MNNEHLEERSYSVAVCYYETHLGDIEYTVTVEEFADKLFARGYSKASRMLAAEPRAIAPEDNREKLVDGVFDDMQASLLELLRQEGAVKMLRAVAPKSRRPPGFALVCSNGGGCSTCDSCKALEALRARKKRVGCSCALDDYLPFEQARLLDKEKYGTVLERVDGSDTIRIVSAGDQNIDELVEQLSWKHAQELVEHMRSANDVPRTLLNLLQASIPQDVRPPEIGQAPGPVGLSEEQLVANAHMNSTHLKTMRTLLRKVESVGLEIATYREGMELGTDSTEAKAALTMASATIRHTGEWLARAVPGGIRSAVYGKVDAPLKSAALALAKIGKTQAEIAGVLKVDKKTVARYLAKTKESERSLARGSKNPTEPWRSKRNMSF